MGPEDCRTCLQSCCAISLTGGFVDSGCSVRSVLGAAVSDTPRPGFPGNATPARHLCTKETLEQRLRGAALQLESACAEFPALPGRVGGGSRRWLDAEPAARPGRPDALRECRVGWRSCRTLHPPGHRAPGLELASPSWSRARGWPAGQLLAAGSGCHVAEAAFCSPAPLTAPFAKARR